MFFVCLFVFVFFIVIVIVIFGVGENEKDDCLTMTIKVNCRFLAKMIFSCLITYVSYINTIYVGLLCRCSVLTATIRMTGQLTGASPKCLGGALKNFVYMLGYLFVFPTLEFVK